MYDKTEWRYCERIYYGKIWIKSFNGRTWKTYAQGLFNYKENAIAYLNNEDVEEFLSDSENSLLQKMNTSIDTSMDDATELIEKQEIL